MMPLEECGKHRDGDGMKQENSRHPYRVAFVDLDDTLLGPDKRISPANLAAMDRLRSEGVQLTVASGRHHRNITAFEQIGEQAWILSSHGSVVRHEQTGEVLLEMTMDPQLVPLVCERARALGIGVIAYHRDGAYLEQSTAWTDLYAREAGWEPQRTDFRALAPLGFQKLIWADHPDRIAELAPVLKKEFATRLSVLVTNPELLEFFAPAANKAVGAETLTHKLGFAPEEALAFGDGNNDVELLRWAGLSVAMPHGRETARQAARFIAPSGPPENAFARAVELAFARG